MEPKLETSARWPRLSLAESLIVVALVGILASVLLLNVDAGAIHDTERTLQANLQALRTAINEYRSDHGQYPCSREDHDYPCSDAQLRSKLLLPSRADGKTNPVPNAQFCYGPYLNEFPAEPFSQSRSIEWSLEAQRIRESIAQQIQLGRGQGGWFYEPSSGNILANLGERYPSKYARF